MRISSDSFSDGHPIPGEFAFCVPDPDAHVSLAPNRNPHLAWDDVPEGTESFALICHDRDVPTSPEEVNRILVPGECRYL